MVTIEVLGMGCRNCSLLAERADAAATRLKLPHAVVKVTDLQKIARYGVVTTPALVVDGVVKFAGHVPTIEVIEECLAATPPA